MGKHANLSDARAQRGHSDGGRASSEASGEILREAAPQARETRVHLEVDVSFASESHFYAGLTGDVSQGGLFVSSYVPRRLGENILLRFTLLGELIEVGGVVRWLRAGSPDASPGFGVELRELPPAAAASIRTFCSKRAALYYEGDDEALSA